MSDPKDVLTKKHIDTYNKAINDDGQELQGLLQSEDSNVMCFDTGWVIFEFNGNVCFVTSYYKHKDSKCSAEKYWESFKEVAQINGCTKIRMQTHISPEFWEKNYGFKHYKHIMELEL